MTSVLGLVFLVIIAIIGKYLLDKIRIKSIGFNFLVYSGFYYLVLGILSGHNILNIFDLSMIKKIEFFFDFILGWTGFLIGLQMNVKGIKRFPTKYYFFSLIHFALSFLIVSFLLVLFKLFVYPAFSYLYILLLAILGSMSSVLGVGLLVNERKIRSVNAHFLQFTAAFDNVLGIIVLGLLFFVHQLLRNNFSNALLISGFTYLVVILLAYFYKYLDDEFRTVEEETLLILGLILIVVGMSRYLHNSILFLSFLLGVLIINMKVDSKKILMTIQEWEKPLNFILLFAIGLYLNFNINEMNYLLLALLMVMMVAKYFSGRFYRIVKLHNRPQKKESNFVLYGMSSLSLAIILDAYFTNHNPILLKILTVVVLSYYLTNILVFYLVKEKPSA